MYKGPEQIWVKTIGFLPGTTFGKVYVAKAAAVNGDLNCHYRIKNDIGLPVSVGVLPNKLKSGWELVKEE